MGNSDNLLRAEFEEGEGSLVAFQQADGSSDGIDADGSVILAAGASTNEQFSFGAGKHKGVHAHQGRSPGGQGEGGGNTCRGCENSN